MCVSACESVWLGLQVCCRVQRRSVWKGVQSTMEDCVKHVWGKSQGKMKKVRNKWREENTASKRGNWRVKTRVR